MASPMDLSGRLAGQFRAVAAGRPASVAMGVVLALSASLLFGTSDFIGGMVAKRHNAVAVLGASQGIALFGLVPIAVLAGELGASGYLTPGVISGVSGAIGLAAFYTGLARGTMGVVAPIASTGVAVPVLGGLAQGETPGPIVAVGLAVAIIGIVFASGPERRRRRQGGRERLTRLASNGIGLAVLAAIGFGTALTTAAEGAESSVIMTLVAQRTAAAVVATAYLGIAGPKGELGRLGRDAALPVLAIGVLDTAANGAFALASNLSLVAVSAVLSSLYPAVTAVLAWRFAGEHLRRVQIAGAGLIIAGVASIAAGGA